MVSCSLRLAPQTTDGIHGMLTNSPPGPRWQNHIRFQELQSVGAVSSSKIERSMVILSRSNNIMEGKWHGALIGTGGSQFNAVNLPRASEVRRRKSRRAHSVVRICRACFSSQGRSCLARCYNRSAGTYWMTQVTFAGLLKIARRRYSAFPKL